MEAVKTYVATLNGQINGDRFKAGDEFKYDKELDSYHSPVIKRNIPREVMEQLPKETFIPKEKISIDDDGGGGDDFLDKLVNACTPSKGVPDFVISLLQSMKKSREKKLINEPDNEECKTQLKETDRLIGQANELNVRIKKRKDFVKIFGTKPESGITVQAIPTELAWRAKRVELLRFSLNFENIAGDIEGTRNELTKHEKWIASKLQGKMTIEELIEAVNEKFN